MTHTLIVLPDDTAKPILDPINAATHALNRSFLFRKTLLCALIAAKHPRVKAGGVVNPARRSGAEKKPARRSLPRGLMFATATPPST